MAPSHSQITMAPSAIVALVLSALVGQAASMPQERPGRATGVPLAVEGDQPVIQLHVTSSGEMIRREAPPGKDAAAGLADIGAKHAADPAIDIRQDGAVTVAAPALSSSEETKLEELTEECMQDEPTSECMEKFGSYGVRKLYTESWDNVVKLGYLQQGWMSHPAVQKRKLFEVTLPGSANSGTYAVSGKTVEQMVAAPYGVVSQNLNFYSQLELGIRAFDVKVAYSTDGKLVYISHGDLMIPLGTALRDMRRFLEEHSREVIVLDVRKDTLADKSRLKPFADEDMATDRIPGQLVHEAVKCELKDMLATHAVLSKLPADMMAENPTIGALADLGAQAIYFYDGQQVLCTSLEECAATPGWFMPSRRSGDDFAFGPPMVLGLRANITGSKDGGKTTTSRIIEPACQVHSDLLTKDDQPEKLMKKIHSFSSDMTSSILHHRPKCYPVGAASPHVHQPTLWYTVDGYVTNTPEEQATQTDRMRGVKAIYTRGEGFTVKSSAERTNYLLLSWFLKKGSQAIYTKPNVILFEFVGSAMMPIRRIIETQQSRPECGWAIYCKESGSCWADTLLGKMDKCIREEEVVAKLKDHVEGKEAKTAWVVYSTIIGFTFLLLICMGSSIRSYTKKILKPKSSRKTESGAEGGPEDTGEATDDQSGSEGGLDLSSAAAGGDVISGEGEQARPRADF